MNAHCSYNPCVLFSWFRFYFYDCGDSLSIVSTLISSYQFHHRNFRFSNRCHIVIWLCCAHIINAILFFLWSIIVLYRWSLYICTCVMACNVYIILHNEIPFLVIDSSKRCNMIVWYVWINKLTNLLVKSIWNEVKTPQIQITIISYFSLICLIRMYNACI